MSNKRKARLGIMYKDSRKTSGATSSSCSGEYDAAIVVHATDRNIRFKLVDHELSIGIARNEPSGKAIGARIEDSSALILHAQKKTNVLEKQK